MTDPINIYSALDIPVLSDLLRTLRYDRSQQGPTIMEDGAPAIDLLAIDDRVARIVVRDAGLFDLTQEAVIRDQTVFGPPV